MHSLVELASVMFDWLLRSTAEAAALILLILALQFPVRRWLIWMAVQRDLMNGANRRDARGSLHRLHKGLRMRSFSMSCPIRP